MSSPASLLIKIIKEKPPYLQYFQEMITFINNHECDFHGPVIHFNRELRKIIHISWVCPSGIAQDAIYEESTKRRHLFDCKVGYQIITEDQRASSGKPLLLILEDNISLSIDDESDINYNHPIQQSDILFVDLHGTCHLHAY